jgi:hypothetical protein
VSVDEKYRWQRQEPGYHSCHCGCRKSKMLAIASLRDAARTLAVGIVPQDTPSLTLSSYPGFFVHVLKIEKRAIDSPDGKLDAEFRLIVSATDSEVYRTKIPISGEGIIEINLPNNAPGLEVRKDYEWEFVIFCNVDDYSESIEVRGLVRRVEPSAKLISQLKQANPLQTAVIYAKNGIWVESISTLAQLRREYPQNLRVMDYWRFLRSAECKAHALRTLSLLKSVDLQDISQQPFK